MTTETKQKLANVASIAPRWITAAVVCIGAVIAVGMLKAEVHHTARRVEALEETVKQDHDTITALKSDVTYIKAGIDEIKTQLRR